ncbi:SP_0198 family lipoprotein [Streptococcus anginosus]|uniref:SP_0198 family lipoprotein n=1 Tax=Streptococcus anginosus TaxID=1328 RepID=UPI0022E8C47D|nr:SP_0198 family lipoprotein [Streptococcus anginosus]
MAQLKKFCYVAFFLIGLIILTSCAKSNQTSPSSQSVSSSQSTTVSGESGTSSTIAENSSEKLDGTYKGMDEEEEITLAIKGNSGTWTEKEPNGKEEVKQVSIDPTNQRMTIGDDIERYMIDGKQLTIEDIEQENGENDTVVLTKQ